MTHAIATHPDQMTPVQTPPYSEAAEQAVLSAMLLDSDAIATAGKSLNADAFFNMAHRKLFSAMNNLRNRDDAVDPLTLVAELERMESLESTGGRQYIGYLTDVVPTAANVEYHAKIVRKYAQRRQLIKAADDARSLAYRDDAEPDEIARQLQADTLPIAVDDGEQGFRVVSRSDIDSLGDAIHARGQATSEGRIPGLATGFPEIDDVTQGFRLGEYVTIGAVPKMWKALIETTRVRTTAGWRPIKDLSVGDEVMSIDGGPSRVTGVYPQGEKDVLRMHFSDGVYVDCCAEHLWEVRHRRWPSNRVATTAEIEAMIATTTGRGRLSVPLVCGETGESAEVPLDPYLVGALIGDGNLTNGSPRLMNPDPDVIARVRDALPEGYELRRESRPDHYRLVAASRPKGRATLQAVLRSLGLAGRRSYEKSIPSSYLRASRSDRMKLLHGLLDTDGYTSRNGSVAYSTTSPGLVRDVSDLVRSLGGLVHVSEIVNSTYTYKGERRVGRQAYTVTIKAGPWILELLTLERHRKHLPRATRREPRRVITRIERLGYSAPMVCITVSHPSALFVVENYVLTHNTALLDNILLNMIRGGAVVGKVSAEIGKAQTLERMIAADAMIPINTIARGSLVDEEWRRFLIAGNMLEGKLHIDDQAYPELTDVITRCTDLKSRVPSTSAIGVDYLQLVTARMHGRRGDEEINTVSRALKGLAKRLNVIMFAPFQCNFKEIDKRDDKRPQKSDAQGASGPVQDADFCVLLYTDTLYNPTALPILEANFAACRRTAPFVARLKMYPEFQLLGSDKAQQRMKEKLANHNRNMELL